jgi:hypothetical protein
MLVFFPCGGKLFTCWLNLLLPININDVILLGRLSTFWLKFLPKVSDINVFGKLKNPQGKFSVGWLKF